MPPPEPPAPTPSQPESSSNGQSEPNSEKERIHLRLRGAAPALMDLHKAFGTEPRKSDEPPADQNTIRFAYQAVASHLRPLIRDRCSYHIIDDAAALELLSTLPPELKPSEGAELRLADMRLTDGEYELQPHLQRWRDICEEAELWDDKTIISTVLRGGRYQVLILALTLTLAAPLTLTLTVTPTQPYQVLGFRAILQTRGQSVDGGCLFRVLWQPEARRLVLNTTHAIPTLYLTWPHSPGLHLLCTRCSPRYAHHGPAPQPNPDLTPQPKHIPIPIPNRKPSPSRHQARRLVLNTLAFAVDAGCRGQGIGTRMVDVLGLLLKAEAVRATQRHGEP